MKAIRIHEFGSSERLVLEETRRPTIGKDQVLIRIQDAGVNPMDWKVREGQAPGPGGESIPLTLGQDVAGEVVQVGTEVQGLAMGDEVFGFARGAYAELAAAFERELARKPRFMDFVTAASLPTAGLTAWQLVTEALRLSKGQRVLIHGAAGEVGYLAIQLARWRGARVIAAAEAADMTCLAGLGVERIIDYRASRFERELGGLDAVVDLIGGETLERSYVIVRKGGILVSSVGEPDRQELDRRGLRGIRFLMRKEGAGLAELARLVTHGVVKPRLAQVLPLSDARKAQDLSQSGKYQGKIVLRVA